MSFPSFIRNENGELWLTEDERENLKISYRIKEVIYSEQSKFQHVMILDTYDFGRMLVLDGVVQTTSIDGFIYNEMISHVPLNIHPDPKNVLIIGGGDCGVAREAVKYTEVEHVDMVEIDEMVVDVCKAHLPEISGNLSDPRVNFVYGDGVEFVKNAVGKYDVIIIDSSDPVGPAEQLFSLSFYQSVERALKDDGLMVCQSQSPVFHFEIMQQTYHYIESLFPYARIYTAVVPTYPGGMWSFTLGTKKHRAAQHEHLIKDTNYINEKILQHCFDFPEFLKRKL